MSELRRRAPSLENQDAYFFLRKLVRNQSASNSGADDDHVIRQATQFTFRSHVSPHWLAAVSPCPVVEGPIDGRIDANRAPHLSAIIMFRWPVIPKARLRAIRCEERTDIPKVNDLLRCTKKRTVYAR